MADNTTIEWCDHTFNPWEGCQKVSPGCDHCYAETRNARFNGTAVNWGPGAPRRRTSEANWKKPLKWNREAQAFFAAHGRRQRVFCASLADVFDNAVAPQWRRDLFNLILQTPHLDWLLLTKRIGNVSGVIRDQLLHPLPPNVWLGITVVNQEEADRDIPKLLATQASVRFLSMEPLLGPVDLTMVPTGGHIDGHIICESALRWKPEGQIDWVIVGGESGPGARPMHPDWARSLRDQCETAGAPFLFKQWGEWYLAVDRERDDPDWRRDYGNALADNGRTRWLNIEGGRGFHGERFVVMRRHGKAQSGRRLDGIEHNGFPEVRA